MLGKEIFFIRFFSQQKKNIVTWKYKKTTISIYQRYETKSRHSNMNNTQEKSEAQANKRKRSIMNDEQIAMIEKSLMDEPHIRLKAATLQTWINNLNHIVRVKSQIQFLLYELLLSNTTLQNI